MLLYCKCTGGLSGRIYWRFIGDISDMQHSSQSSAQTSCGDRFNGLTVNLRTCCFMFTVYGAGSNDFDVGIGQIHYKGHWKGWVLKIE
jgi:hypothetical protein